MSKRQDKRTRRQKKTDQVLAKQEEKRLYLAPVNAGREEFLKCKTEWPEKCPYKDLEEIALYSQGFATAKKEYLDFDLKLWEFKTKMNDLCKEYGCMVRTGLGEALVRDGQRVFEFDICVG
jgi:hypothetical protein